MIVRPADRQLLIDAIGRMAREDRMAMRTVYEHTSAKLYGVCLRVLGDAGTAEEVLQDVYMKIWHNADRFDPAKASPITWLCSIARNTAIDRLRTIRRTPVADGEVAETIADDLPTSDIVLEQREEHARMAACIGLLDGEHARCIRAAFFDGYSYVDLAVRHAVPIGTMKSWMRRSLIRLRECLDHG